MELILWRHADAEYSLPDWERLLTEKGQRQARKMAAYLAPRLPKELRILVSPARRAQQTAEALGLGFETEHSIAPEASADAVLQAAHWPNAAGCILIVGHQPTLGLVASRLLSGSDAGMSLRKGALCWISSRIRGDETQGVLRLAMTPDAL